MKCRNCQDGRRFAEGSINCTWYGMVLRADHECTRERGKHNEENAVERPPQEESNVYGFDGEWPE